MLGAQSGLIKSAAGIISGMTLAVAVARADIGCSETISALIMHSNGSVYFTTSQTCTNWCTINYGSADANNKAYAMLLTALSQGKSVWFDWGNLNTCANGANPTNTSPSWFAIGP